jgi:hypothetical protein
VHERQQARVVPCQAPQGRAGERSERVAVHLLVVRDRRLDDVRGRRHIRGTAPGEEVAAEERRRRLLEHDARLPRTGNVRGVDPAYAQATEVEDLSILEWAWRARSHVGEAEKASRPSVRRLRVRGEREPVAEGAVLVGPRHMPRADPAYSRGIGDACDGVPHG